MQDFIDKKKVTNDIYPSKLNITISTPLDVTSLFEKDISTELEFPLPWKTFDVFDVHFMISLIIVSS